MGLGGSGGRHGEASELGTPSQAARAPTRRSPRPRTRPRWPLPPLCILSGIWGASGGRDGVVQEVLGPIEDG
jgi:hypothetical protein